jgi:NAD(P)-dependent dehydrogenase (short-subunit alcohol dehydrogenase family)
MSSLSSDLDRSARQSRRVSAGEHVLLADLRQENADAAAEVLSNAGFDVSTATVDVSSRESVHALVQTATALGDVSGLIYAACELCRERVHFSLRRRCS